MKEISKEEIIQEALDKTKFEEEKIKENSKYLIENLAIIFSISTVFIFLVLYSFNKGYYRAYNIAESCITVDLTDFLPVALQLCGVYIYIVFYLVQLKKDKILKRKRLNFLRVLYGELVVNYVLTNAQVGTLIGAVPVLLVSIAIPMLIELFWWLLKMPRKNKMYSKVEKQLVLEGMIEDRMLYLINNKYALGIMVIIITFASMWGNICAKAKKEYQIFEKEGTSYAVIIDQGESIIAEKIHKENDMLFIDATCYMYVAKEDKIFYVEQYSNVKIEN